MLYLHTTGSAEEEDYFIYKLFSRICLDYPNINVAISPKSIEMCIGLVLFSSQGDTYQQIRDFLKIKLDDDFEIACYFHGFFTNCRISSLIKIALNMFPSIQYEMKPQIIEILKTAFRSVPEHIDYEKSEDAAEHINCWAKYKTSKRVKDVVKPSNFKKETSLVLVSVVYVEAAWRIPFNPKKTFNGRFFVNAHKSIPVNMMTVCDEFYVGNIPELYASAVELGLEYSDLSMVIFLPNSKTGLKKMMKQALRLDIFTICREFNPQKVQLCVPQFETQFGLELAPDLKYLGLTSMFSCSANFDSLLRFPKQVQVSSIFHKIFIKINEYGIDVEPFELEDDEKIIQRKEKISPEKKILVDRPFMYIIKDSNTLYFIGYVVQATKRTRC